MIKATVLKRSGHAFLVQYIDEDKFTKKVIVPEEYLASSDGKVVELSEEDLDKAIPYGLAWEEYLSSVHISGKDIARALYAHGILTHEDYKNNPNRVLGAVREAAAPILREINTVISGLRKNEEV